MTPYPHQVVERQAHYARRLAAMPDDIRQIITRQLPREAAADMLLALDYVREGSGPARSGRSDDYHLGAAHSQIQAAVAYGAISEMDAARLHDYLTTLEDQQVLVLS